MSRSDRRLLAAAAALATAALAVGIGRTDLWPPDETRVAEISREMRAERSWLVPRLNGTPFLEEPPLFYWLQAGAYRLAGGPSAAAARWPATVAAVLGVLVTMLLARAVGASAGIAALILATAPEYWWMGRSGGRPPPFGTLLRAQPGARPLLVVDRAARGRGVGLAGARRPGQALRPPVGGPDDTRPDGLGQQEGPLPPPGLPRACGAGRGVVGTSRRTAPRSGDMVVLRGRAAVGMPGSRPRPALPRAERRHGHGRDRERPSDDARAGAAPGADRRRVVGSGAVPRAARVGLPGGAAGSEAGAGRRGRRGVRDRAAPRHRDRSAPPVRPVLQHAPMG